MHAADCSSWNYKQRDRLCEITRLIIVKRRGSAACDYQAHGARNRNRVVSNEVRKISTKKAMTQIVERLAGVDEKLVQRGTSTLAGGKPGIYRTDIVRKTVGSRETGSIAG